MKKILIIFILFFSSSVVAAENDVYYCETEKFTIVKKNLVETFKNEKFKFKRNENTLQFSGTGYFGNTVMTIEWGHAESEWFFGNYARTDSFNYKNGIFLYTFANHIGESKIVSILATCDIF